MMLMTRALQKKDSFQEAPLDLEQESHDVKTLVRRWCVSID